MMNSLTRPSLLHVLPILNDHMIVDWGGNLITSCRNHCFSNAIDLLSHIYRFFPCYPLCLEPGLSPITTFYLPFKVYHD
jgi:hypothetical protein